MGCSIHWFLFNIVGCQDVYDSVVTLAQENEVANKAEWRAVLRRNPGKRFHLHRLATSIKILHWFQPLPPRKPHFWEETMMSLYVTRKTPPPIRPPSAPATVPADRKD